MKVNKYILVIVTILATMFSCTPPETIEEDHIPPIHATGDEIDDLADPDEDE